MSLIPRRALLWSSTDDEAVRDSLQWLLEGKTTRVRCSIPLSLFSPALTPAKSRA